MPPVISVENISKKFQIGLREKRHQTFREALMDTVSAPLRRFRHLSGKGHEESDFWALKDVSFEVQEGEVLGIIGRNGAGKSTLLKILSRITEPTSGRAIIRGRVASLLEVGTGFHNELSGRENVYLNGAILGMSKSEIDRKFDEIVDFSGVEKFLDTAIKHYSSGMKVRLAFAVAAHLDPEILIIDEVLAVGDQEFQNKCMGKMQDVAEGGRTVLFVSHNMASTERLCKKALLIESGRPRMFGDCSEVITQYLSQHATIVTHSLGPMDAERSHISQLQLCDEDGNALPYVSNAQAFGVLIEFYLAGWEHGMTLAVAVANSAGHYLFSSTPADSRISMPVEPGRFRVHTLFPKKLLMPNQFEIVCSLYSRSTNIHQARLRFRVEERDSDLYPLQGGRVGDIQVQAAWSIFTRLAEPASACPAKDDQ